MAFHWSLAIKSSKQGKFSVCTENLFQFVTKLTQSSGGMCLW